MENKEKRLKACKVLQAKATLACYLGFKTVIQAVLGFLFFSFPIEGLVSKASALGSRSRGIVLVMLASLVVCFGDSKFKLVTSD